MTLDQQNNGTFDDDYKTRKSLPSLNVDNILRFESVGDLSLIYFIDEKKEKKLSTKKLTDYEKELPKGQFFRAHKQHLINLLHVDDLHLKPTLEISLTNGEKIQLARRRKKGFLDHLSQFKKGYRSQTKNQRF